MQLVDARPGHGGSGASCSVRMTAPAAAHAAADAVDVPSTRPSARPGTAATASTGCLRHRIPGVGTGAIAIASTSASVRDWSPSIFRNMSPTRSVTRWLFAEDNLDLLHGGHHRGRPDTAGALRAERRSREDSCRTSSPARRDSKSRPNRVHRQSMNHRQGKNPLTAPGLA